MVGLILDSTLKVALALVAIISTVGLFAFMVVQALTARDLEAVRAELNQLKSTNVVLREVNQVTIAPTQAFATGFANLSLYYAAGDTLVCGQMRAAGSARTGFEEPQNATAEALPTFVIDRDGRNIAIVVPK